MIGSIIQTVLIKIQSQMREQEKKRQRIYDLLSIETKPHPPKIRNNWSFFMASIMSRPLLP